MDNSFALWHDKRDKEKEISGVEIHFNLWQFSSEKNNCLDCLDIGIKIKKIGNFHSIHFFVPFLLTDKNIGDLGRIITKNRKLLTAIFNEFSTIGKEEAKLVDVTLDNEGVEATDESFKVYIIDKTNDFRIKPVDEDKGENSETVGTLITIDTSKISSDIDIPVYLRIRIELPPQLVLGKMLRQYVPKDSWLHSSNEKQQFIDFRLNEKRNLPTVIQEQCKGKLLQIEKVHFFLMREYSDGQIWSEPDCSGCRVLENDIWSEYFNFHSNKCYELDHMIAYHWKDSPNKTKNEKHINSFKLLTKFSFVESSNWKIIIYIFIGILIGLGCSVGANFLTRWIDTKLDSIERIEQDESNSAHPSIKIDKIEKESAKEDN